MNLKGHTVPGILKANFLVLANFVHLGRSKIKSIAMSQPLIKEPHLQRELSNTELPSHLQKPLSLLECWCDSEKPASKLMEKLSFWGNTDGRNIIKNIRLDRLWIPPSSLIKADCVQKLMAFSLLKKN